MFVFDTNQQKINFHNFIPCNKNRRREVDFVLLSSLTLLKDEKLNAKWINMLRNCIPFKETVLRILVFLVQQNSPKTDFH